MLPVVCVNCGRPYPDEGAPYRCPVCGGVYDFAAPLRYDPKEVDSSAPGIWKYRHSLSLPEDAPSLSLGEGGTSLVWKKIFRRRVAFKCEYENPTGSFKDRGEAVLVSWLVSRGVKSAVEDSSGNAGASFAAYAARAELRARVFVPKETAAHKKEKIAAYGAELVEIEGTRSEAGEAARKEAERGAVYASHAFLPFNLPGYATLAYELVEDLGGAPGAVLLPAGQGGLLLGIARGFQALLAAGVIQHFPQLVGVQALACAPLWALSEYGPSGLGFVTEAPTLAEGVRVRFPVRGERVIQTIAENGGFFVAVGEEDILPARDELARRGLYVEPTSALVWHALRETLPRLQDPVAVILTGAGKKTKKFKFWRR